MDCLECPICTEQYGNTESSYPYLLYQCGHTICYSCLTKLHADNKLCPECRSFIAGSARNYALCNIIEYLSRSPAQGNGNSCNGHGAESVGTPLCTSQRGVCVCRESDIDIVSLDEVQIKKIIESISGPSAVLSYLHKIRAVLNHPEKAAIFVVSKGIEGLITAHRTYPESREVQEAVKDCFTLIAKVDSNLISPDVKTDLCMQILKTYPQDLALMMFSAQALNDLSKSQANIPKLRLVGALPTLFIMLSNHQGEAGLYKPVLDCSRRIMNNDSAYIATLYGEGVMHWILPWIGYAQTYSLHAAYECLSTCLAHQGTLKLMDGNLTLVFVKGIIELGKYNSWPMLFVIVRDMIRNGKARHLVKVVGVSRLLDLIEHCQNQFDVVSELIGCMASLVQNASDFRPKFLEMAAVERLLGVLVATYLKTFGNDPVTKQIRVDMTVWSRLVDFLQQPQTTENTMLALNALLIGSLKGSEFVKQFRSCQGKQVMHGVLSTHPLVNRHVCILSGFA
mmetsp:Transcript_20026/g.34462  ORF Transcript_20026/g.34462 Transcript_20026/m.34462 type:complete len:509 (-) Transcript_20026:861-2387(-)